MSLNKGLPASLTVTFSYSTAGRLALTEFTKIYNETQGTIYFNVLRDTRAHIFRNVHLKSRIQVTTGSLGTTGTHVPGIAYPINV